MADEPSGSTEPKVLSEQGILLFNLVDITKGRLETGIKNTVFNKEPVSNLQNFKNAINSDSVDNLLPSVCLIDTKNASGFMNLLKGDPKQNDMLLRMSTFELSSLVPVVRIFKIFRNPSTREEIILELPFDTKAAGIESIYQNSAGRGTGAGVISFRWKQNPKNESSVAIYKVNLDLHLQNIQEFYKQRNATMVGNVLLDVSIQDLLYQRKDWRKQTNEGTAVYNADDYIMKAIVGWEISEGGLESLRKNNSRQDVDLFLDAVKNQKEVLYLNFVSHTIEFNDDGSVGLNIDFIGRADNILNDIESSNILTVGAEYEKQIQYLKEQIKQSTELGEQLSIDDKKQQQDQGTIARWVGWDTDAKDNLDKNKASLDRLKKELENTIQASKKAKYNYYITKIIQKKQMHLFTYSKEVIELLSKVRGVYNLSSPTDLKNVEDAQLKLKEAEDLKKQKMNPTGNYQIPQVTRLAQNMSSEASEKLQRIVTSSFDINTPITRGFDDSRNFDKLDLDSDDFDKKEVNSELFDILAGGNFAGSAEIPEGMARFPFFYLSSLIDVLVDPIMDTNKKNPNFINKKLRVILGPMTITDYGTLEDSGQTYRIFDSIEAEQENKPKYVKVFTGKQRIINIGDVPISLKEFTNWFNENVVNKNIDRMALNDFITSLVNELVMSSLTNNIYTYAPKQKARLAIDAFTSVCNPNNETAFLYNIQEYRPERFNYEKPFPAGGGFRIAQSALETLRTKSEHAEKDHDPTSESFLPRKDYLVIYCINNSPYERIGDYEEDKKDGILHLHLGDSKGIIRNVKFSRVDNPHRRADNILAGTSSGQGVSKIIREKYNVSLETFGNTVLQAGTYVYLMPYYGGDSGVAQTAQFLKEIGLGGYYMITEVDNTVEVGDFKTEIRGTWSAFGDGKLNDGEKEYAPTPNGAIPEKGILQ